MQNSTERESQTDFHKKDKWPSGFFTGKECLQAEEGRTWTEKDITFSCNCSGNSPRRDQHKKSETRGGTKEWSSNHNKDHMNIQWYDISALPTCILCGNYTWNHTWESQPASLPLDHGYSWVKCHSPSSGDLFQRVIKPVKVTH